MLFLIAYELGTPRRGDAEIVEALEAVNAKRVLRSTWVLSSDLSSTTGLADYLSRHADPADRLLVVEVGAAWSTGHAVLAQQNVPEIEPAPGRGK